MIAKFSPQETVASLQEIEADVAKGQSSADDIARSLLDVTSEIDARIAENTKLLTTSPSLDVLYRLKLAWRKFSVRLSVAEVELTRHAASMEEQLARVDQLNKTWQATFQSAKQPQTPPPVLERVQIVVDSVERTRQATESGQEHILTLQSHLSEEEARVRRALSSIDRAENQALQNIFVRDSQPLWSLETSLAAEWQKQRNESFRNSRPPSRPALCKQRVRPPRSPQAPTPTLGQWKLNYWLSVKYSKIFGVELISSSRAPTSCWGCLGIRSCPSRVFSLS